MTYRQVNAINQSRLKIALKSIWRYFHNIKEEDNDESKALVMGSLVDTLLTEPNELNNRFYITEMEAKPSDNIAKLIRDLFQFRSLQDITEESLEQSLDLSQWDTFILQWFEDNNLYVKWKDETKLKKVLEEGTQYWNELLVSEGKQVISVEEYDKATKLADSFKESEYAYFLEFQTQFECYGQIDDENCKGLCDFIIFNYSDEIVHYPHFSIRPKFFKIIDYKTFGNFLYWESFYEQIKRFRYDFQLQFYNKLVQEMIFQDTGVLYYYENPLIIAQSTKDYDIQTFEVSYNTLMNADKDIHYCINKVKNYTEVKNHKLWTI